MAARSLPRLRVSVRSLFFLSVRELFANTASWHRHQRAARLRPGFKAFLPEPPGSEAQFLPPWETGGGHTPQDFCAHGGESRSKVDWTGILLVRLEPYYLGAPEGSLIEAESRERKH